MKLEMADNALFAILLRSPWWMSLGIAAGIVLAARLVLPPAYALYGAFGALPFLLIGVASAWKQLQAPSATRIADTLVAIRKMSSGDFLIAIGDALRADGHVVSRLSGGAAEFAEFETTKGLRTSLVACKRWKAARTGIEPLRELHALKEAREAHECIYVAAGEISGNARAFASEKKIRIMEAAELAQLLRGVGRVGRAQKR